MKTGKITVAKSKKISMNSIKNENKTTWTRWFSENITETCRTFISNKLHNNYSVCFTNLIKKFIFF